MLDENALAELVSGVVSLMRDKIAGIILYGSVARGTDSAESDVDIALITRGEVSDTMRSQLLDLSVDLDLAHDRIFSLICVDEAKFVQWQDVIPFYMNGSREGVVLWSAA